MTSRERAAPMGGPAAPASAMAFRPRELDEAHRDLDVDDLVERVVERVEERVLTELQRRGHRGAIGVF